MQVFNYIFNVSSFYPTFGLHAVNFTKLFVQLKCDYDLQTIQEVELGKYRSGSPIMIIPVDDFVHYTFHICKPDSYSLENISGYLRRYSMPQLQRLDPTQQNLSLTIYTQENIQCQLGMKPQHTFKMRLQLLGHADRLIKFNI
jgi:hypothetical protein